MPTCSLCGCQAAGLDRQPARKRSKPGSASRAGPLEHSFGYYYISSQLWLHVSSPPSPIIIIEIRNGYYFISSQLWLQNNTSN